MCVCDDSFRLLACTLIDTTPECGLALCVHVCTCVLACVNALSPVQANPYGSVQFVSHQQQMMRSKRETQGMDVLSGYSSDSRPSVLADGDFENLDWQDQAILLHLSREHQMLTHDVDAIVRKTICECATVMHVVPLCLKSLRVSCGVSDST